MNVNAKTAPQRLKKLAADIAANGDAPLTRLTVLKKWFETPGRMEAFAVWMARQAITGRAMAERGKVTGEATQLFKESAALIKSLDAWRPRLSAEQRKIADGLYQRMRDFQNEHRNVHWTRVRIIKVWNLLLVEKSIGILIGRDRHPTDAYKLAADYCQNYDPRYGNGLNGPSRKKILAIARWATSLETKTIVG